MLIDTHIFLWFATADLRLPAGIREKLEGEPGSVAISSVSFWEVMLLSEKGRIELDVPDPGQWMSKEVLRIGLQQVPVTSEIAVLSRTLPFRHEDPADRFIAATAKHLNLPLATADAKMLGLPWLRYA